MVAMTPATRRGGRRPGCCSSLARMEDCRWPSVCVCVCVCVWVCVCVCADGHVLDLSFSIREKTKTHTLSIPALRLLWLHWFPLSRSLTPCVSRRLVLSKIPLHQSHKPHCGGVTYIRHSGKTHIYTHCLEPIQLQMDLKEPQAEL